MKINYSFIPQKLHPKYKLIRQNVEHEDNLINHRFSWLIIAQSFLLAACINYDKYPLAVILAGLFSVIFTYISIWAAIRAIAKLHKLAPFQLKKSFPPIISEPKIHYCGLVGPIGVPLVFFFIWLWLLYCHHLCKYFI